MSSITVKVKESTSKLTIFGRTMVAASLAVVTASAQAQSYANSGGDLSYSFSADTSVNDYTSYLTVNDNGMTTYNLIDSSAAAYVATTGTGSGSATVSPNNYYDNSSWQGYSQITVHADESGAVGTASASVGSQEGIYLGLDAAAPGAITIDVTASGYAAASLGITSASNPENFASVDTYLGIYDFDLTTLKAVANPLVHLTGTDAIGVVPSYSSEWSTSQINGLTYYTANYVMTIQPGEAHALEFYTSGKAITSANPVPAPSSGVAMLAGVIGIVIRKRPRNR